MWPTGSDTSLISVNIALGGGPLWQSCISGTGSPFPYSSRDAVGKLSALTRCFTSLSRVHQPYSHALSNWKCSHLGNLTWIPFTARTLIDTSKEVCNPSTWHRDQNKGIAQQILGEWMCSGDASFPLQQAAETYQLECLKAHCSLPSLCLFIISSAQQHVLLPRDMWHRGCVVSLALAQCWFPEPSH